MLKQDEAQTSLIGPQKCCGYPDQETSRKVTQVCLAGNGRWQTCLMFPLCERADEAMCNRLAPDSLLSNSTHYLEVQLRNPMCL